ncbi:HAMP domain-containing protein [Flavisolibacter nicotianae]|uniref:HAMP domain-containing protein n=1 Tax=Flavisolibacter nicotianae TaxID=2364882 RepID=UPI0013C4D338|nr:HAMP domain-containing protein [Flavisolibacter nicotianae]
MSSFFTYRLRIRQRLSLLICVLLLSVILVFGIGSYWSVRNAALVVGEERLQTLPRQLSKMLAANVEEMLAAARVIAKPQAIKKVLTNDQNSSRQAALAYLSGLQQDSTYAFIEVIDTTGAPVMGTGQAKLQEAAFRKSFFHENFPGCARFGCVGGLYQLGSAVYYPVIVPIGDSLPVLGYLVRWRKMRARSGSGSNIAKLMGDQFAMYIGNTDAGLWTDMDKIVTVPKQVVGAMKTILRFPQPDGDELFASARLIPHTEWVVAVTVPKYKLVAAASRALFWQLLVAGLLLTVGVGLAWVLSRNITRPLNELTAAAVAMTAGNYRPFVQVDRRDEIGKLARAFHTMSRQVSEAQLRLQKEAANYKLLFQKNPMPMWILCQATMKVLDVNEAAIGAYGYSREEFLQLTAKDLRPDEEVASFLAHMQKLKSDQSPAIWKHKTKAGKLLMVEIKSETILYEEHPARLVLANNVTEKLKLENELVQHQIKQQKLIAETTIHAQEKEREELGRELHDNVNQILTSAKLYLELAQGQGTDHLQRGLHKGYQNVNMAIEEIRKLSRKLVPPAFHSTLVETLQGLVEEMQAAASFQLELNVQEFAEDRVSDKLKLILYRIVQEQCNNIIKHAHADQAKIVLETNRDSVCLEITDDGVGLKNIQASKGIGVRNIESRVSFLKGRVSLSSPGGKGCCLKVTIPLPELSFSEEKYAGQPFSNEV